MLDEALLDQAALYAAGALSAAEREQFALIAASHAEVRALVASLESISAFATVGPAGRRPGPELKARLLNLIKDRPQERATDEEGFVITCSGGFVKWVNPAFTAMCGYSLEELQGRKLGPILQGTATDRTVAERMRRAVHERRTCQERILNYHKNGTPYWVEIAITPVANESGEPQWFVARERELPELLAA